jgi:branched-chain amino acid transport system ATP-binding protein
MTAPALAAAGIGVRFGGVVACDGIDLAVQPAEVVGLTGPNGSGKSTFLNAVGGLVPATGSLAVGGRPVPLGRPQGVRDAGVARTFQAPQNYDALSVLDNVLLGCADRRWTGLGAAVARRRALRRAEADRWARAAGALERVGLAPALAASPASGLAYGQQRRLELARAIVGDPSVLLLDEPSAGLNAAETRWVGDLLSSLRDEGVALVVVDHKIDFLDSISDRIVVLELGTVVAEGRPVEIWQDETVIAAYLGKDDDIAADDVDDIAADEDADDDLDDEVAG